MAMMGDSQSDEEDIGLIHRRNRNANQADNMQQEEEEDFYNMEEALTGKVSQWIKEKKTIQFIKQSFGKFLRHFKDEQGQDVYET